jgi:pSer/pThr/pTyr-binding forkhead associated (FHA) protein
MLSDPNYVRSEVLNAIDAKRNGLTVPDLQITSPINGASVKDDSIRIEGKAPQLTKIRIFVDKQSLTEVQPTNNEWSYLLKIKDFGKGNHVITTETWYNDVKMQENNVTVNYQPVTSKPFPYLEIAVLGIIIAIIVVLVVFASLKRKSRTAGVRGGAMGAEPTKFGANAYFLFQGTHKISLSDSEMIVGRDDFRDNLTEHQSKKISSKHITIIQRSGNFYIEDGCGGRSSTNGTTLNGKEIRNEGQRRLKDGDKLRLGDVVEGVFHMSSAAGSTDVLSRVSTPGISLRLALPSGKILDIDGNKVLGRDDFKDEIESPILNKISRNHIEIIFENGIPFVRDGHNGKPSSNGSSLNGSKMEPSAKMELHSGDHLNLAGVIEVIVKMKKQESPPTMPVIERKTTVSDQTQPAISGARLILPSGKVLDVEGSRVFGRNDLIDEVPQDSTGRISRNHFEMIVEGGAYYIKDGLNGKPSMNGTTLNGSKVSSSERSPLSSGDKIMLGEILTLVFKSESKAPSGKEKPTELFIVESKKDPQDQALQTMPEGSTKKKIPMLIFVASDGKRIEVSGNRVFGREDFSGQMPPEKNTILSRRHFEIFFEDGKYSIMDGHDGKASKNGTYLNGVVLNVTDRTELHNGDKMNLGNVLDLSIHLE